MNDLNKEKIVLLFKTFKNLEEIEAKYGNEFLCEVIGAAGGIFGLVGTVSPDTVDKEDMKKYQEERIVKEHPSTNNESQDEYGAVQQMLKAAEERHNIPLKERINAIDAEEQLEIPTAAEKQEKSEIEVFPAIESPQQADIYNKEKMPYVEEDLNNNKMSMDPEVGSENPEKPLTRVKTLEGVHVPETASITETSVETKEDPWESASRVEAGFLANQETSDKVL